MRIKIKYHTVQSQETESFSSMHGWAKWVLIMMLGSSFGRTFYYLGFPPAKIFIGEIVLVLFFLLRPKEFCKRWTSFLISRNVFGPFSWCIFLSILYGLFEVAYGIYSGYSVLTALQNLVFNIYPIYLFLGLWIGSEHPTLLQKVMRGWAWILAIYGPAYLLFLHSVNLTIPGTDGVPVFSQPGGGGFIILSLLALEGKPSRFWPAMVVGAIMMLAIQVRAEWLGTLVAFAIWGVLEQKMTKVLSISALVAVLLVVGFIADVNLPSPAERGGNISSREIVARGLSAIDPELAQEYTDSRNTSFYYGTIYWRTRWWNAIWNSVNESLAKTLIGNGYGFPLKDLVPYLRNTEIRTPHNIFFFALGYTGWVGVVLFFSLEISICGMMWRIYRETGQSYGLAAWACLLIPAFFGNSFETPMGAIPYYLTMGLIIGPVLCHKSDAAQTTSWPRRIRNTGPIAQPAYMKLWEKSSNASVF